MRPSELTFLDVETTGLDPQRHEVVEAAAVRTTLDGRTVLERWEIKLLPQRLEQADPEALRVNAYNEAEWIASGALSQAEGSRSLEAQLRGALLVGQTLPTFDVPFLRATLERHGLGLSWGRHCLDIASLAWPLLLSTPSLEGMRLGQIASALNLVPEGPIHRAAAGAELARKVYVALLERMASASSGSPG